MKIENSGVLAGIGDAGLTPFRYLFHGKTIRIETKDGSTVVHRVASFHKNGSQNSSLTSPQDHKPLCSSSISTIKTIFAVLLVVPGLFLSVAKLFSYSFQDVREKHQLVKKRLTPINRMIGTPENPIQTMDALKKALLEEKNPDDQITNALIIYGNNLGIYDDPEKIIERINPMKLILSGVRILSEPPPKEANLKKKSTRPLERRSSFYPLVDSSLVVDPLATRSIPALYESLGKKKKWDFRYLKTVLYKNREEDLNPSWSLVEGSKIFTLKEALNSRASFRASDSWISSIFPKKYHEIFMIESKAKRLSLS